MAKTKVAVVGAGAFGRNHCRVVHESEQAELTAVVDLDIARAQEAAAQSGARAFTDVRELAGLVEAAIVAERARIGVRARTEYDWIPSRLRTRSSCTSDGGAARRFAWVPAGTVR